MINLPLPDSEIVVPRLLLPTFERLGINTVGDLASLDEYDASKAYGVGVRKLELIRELVKQAKELVGDDKITIEKVTASFSEEDADDPLLFVPSLLSRPFVRDKIDTIRKLFSLQRRLLDGTAGWGDKKLTLLTSLQELYRHLYSDDALDPSVLVGTITDECLLPVPRVGELAISDFVTRSLSDFDLSGAGESDAAGLQRLFAAWAIGKGKSKSSTRSYFGDREIANMEWRDIPLQLNKRGVDFVDRFQLTMLGSLDQMATTGFVEDPETGHHAAVADQQNFGDGSFQRLRRELEKLARLGLDEYRKGIICSLALLPPRDMSWREVPVRMPARVVKFLDKFGLTTIYDIHRLAVRAQVECTETREWLSALDQKNFSERSLTELRSELRKLAEKGLDGYRYGEVGKPTNVADLVRQLTEWVNETEMRVLRLRSDGMTLEDAAQRLDLTRERIRQVELTALKKCDRFFEAADELLLPLDNALHIEPMIKSESGLAALKTDEFWKLLLAMRIAKRSYFVLENDTVSRFSKRQIEALEMLVREALRTQSVKFTADEVSIEHLTTKAPDQEKWFVREWLSIIRDNDLTLTKATLVKLIGVDWLRSHIGSQLVDAGINGLFFDQIDSAGAFETVSDLAELMGDEADILVDGRFRRPGKVYRKADDIVDIVRRAESPISTAEIIEQASDKWHQPHLVRYLSNAYETIQTGRGLYIHIEKKALTVRDILAIASWGAELLAGEKTQVDGALLFDLYQHAPIEFTLDNEFQLVSIVSKHSDVRRISNNLRLAHKNTFDETELYLATTDPDLAAQWHPKKNGKATPENVRPTTSKKYWWLCENGHEFEVSCVYRTRAIRTCPLCVGRWTVAKIRHFVKSLSVHLDSFTPAELYVIFQQSGLWQTGGKSRGFVKALATGRFPKEDLEKFVKAEPSIVDDFLDDEELELEQVQGFDDEIVDQAPSEDDLNETVDCGEEENKLPEVRTKKALAALEHVVLASTDAEAAEFLIASAKAKIWSHVYQNELAAVDEAMTFTGSEYAEQVRNEFLSEYEAARELVIPDGYSFSINGAIQEPNLMQRHVAAQALVRKRYGNWSGTGAGKTLSAILATRVANASLTIVCCPNAVVGEHGDGWATEIVRVYPDSEVATKTLSPTWNGFSDNHRYLVLNYEQLQQPDSEARLKQFVDSNRIDFIVIDEVHYAKQRYADQMSQRKRLMQAMVSAAGEVNPDLRVLGLSATPVINNLQEGRSLVEMITGIEHDDLPVKPTVANCMRLHQRLATLGTRWRPTYEANLRTHTLHVDCSDYLNEIRALGKSHSPLEVEKILTQARLPAILQRLSHSRKTLIYTHYVQEIDQILYNAITDAGYTCGFYTGQLKDGLEAFKSGKLDVLIGSSAIGTGVDGLQHCCDQLIVNVLPWTNAEYEQLIGRVWRQGQDSESVDVIIPTTFAEINGDRWSYCDTKLNRIQYKKSIADAAVDGAVPEGNLRSPGQTQRDIMAWLDRLESGEETTITRRRIVVPLSDDEHDTRRRLARYGDFLKMNNRWNQTASGSLSKRLIENPEEWEQYHTFYREARAKWQVVPVQEMVNWCKRREGYTVGDFGCGEALLSKTVGDRHTIYSFDHVAINDDVIEGDMSRTPLDDESLDVAVFSLSLMGSNFTDYLKEAQRVLKIDGHLHIWEATSRFSDVGAFCSSLERLGFRTFPPTTRAQFTHVEAQKTDRPPNLDVAISM